MPITVPFLDNRRYKDFVADSINRIPIHNPEWTNFNQSDPGVTLIEVFAFLTESLLFRANQSPERMHKKFLQLLSIPLRPAAAAQGLVTINNAKNALIPFTFNPGIELRAGQVPFLTTRGVEILPVEGRFYVKRKITNPAPEVVDYYRQLYASYRGSSAPLETLLYEVTPFGIRASDPLNLRDTIDGAIWLALMVRDTDKDRLEEAREALSSRTLSLGVVPYLPKNSLTLAPGQTGVPAVGLKVECPQLPPDGGLLDSEGREPRYRTLETSATGDVLTLPGLVEIHLPSKEGLLLWNNLDPLEAGVNRLPPSLEDSADAGRVITWLRITPAAPTESQFLWMGINAVTVSQRAQVFAEILEEGTGEPDQVIKLSRAPVLPGSVRLRVTAPGENPSLWSEVDDLYLAGPEVPVPDLRLPPGSRTDVPGPSQVFVVDAEAGELRFGDGVRGARPKEFTVLQADYEYSQGAGGNVGANSINNSPVLPSGFKVANPVETWGGAQQEFVAEGERQVSRYVQHRDRLVTAADFETITLRTPGVEIGRLEVLPTYHPVLKQPGAAGVVTLMVIPTVDAQQPQAPRPTREFLNTLCAYLDTRRLVTTELFLRGPDYRGIWVSIGIDVVPGINDAPVREAVKAAVTEFLAPTKGVKQTLPEDPSALLTAPQAARADKGWPLGKAVNALEISAVAARVSGVLLVRQPVLLAEEGSAVNEIPISGLELPRVLGIRVSTGDPVSIDELRGSTTLAPQTSPGAQPTVVQLPVIPEECR